MGRPDENAVVAPILAVKTLLEYLGQDITREGLRETPLRVVKALEDAVSGYAEDPVAVLKSFVDGAKGTDAGMVVQCNVPVWSRCEHHLLPFFGVAHIGYIPNGRIVGLSKLARVVDILARRLQVQERLGVEVVHAIDSALEPIGAGVVLECRHTCMESRGARAHGTVTTTSCLRGAFKTDAAVRAEFLALAKRDRPI